MTAKIVVWLHVFLLDRENGQVLMLRRSNTGWADGNWSVPAGRLETGESFSQWARRELFEETGVVARRLLPPYVMSHGDANGDRAYFFFICDSWTGTPFNKEPEKCSELVWKSVSDLPEGTLPHVRQALGALLDSDVRYAESGYVPNEFPVE